MTVALARRHEPHIYIAKIVAVQVSCLTLYAEYVQRGRILNRVTVIDPLR